MSYGDHLTANRGAIRFLLLALGIPQALIGLWALASPRTFYDDFPAGTDGWVHVLGPFDEHLVTDVGSLFIALGVVLVFAGSQPAPRRGDRGRHGLADLLRAALPLARLQPRALRHRGRRVRTRSRSAGRSWAACSSWSWRSADPASGRRRRPGHRRADRRGERRPGRAPGPRRLPVLATRVRTVTEPLRVFAHHPRILADTPGSSTPPRRPIACRTASRSWPRPRPPRWPGASSAWTSAR